MCFFPDNAFLEFIPLEEHNKNKADPSYEPRTILYDELELGIYELVLSNFHGGVFVRYRIGDLFRVVSIRDEETDSELPQVRFYSRVDDIIDLSSLVRLTERDIWKTIEGAGIKYQDWAARKEIVHGTPTLHLYIELSRTVKSSEQSIQDALSKGFSTQFSDFNSMKEIMGIDPLKVTIIPEGSFNAYVKSKLAAGADLAHLKPPHMKPSDESLKHLLSVSKG
jgi:phenylacetate-coenzyme A ligase PaaK-like adenylate-forming protein